MSSSDTCRKWNWVLILPVLSGLLLVAGFSVNQVFWDDWGTIHLFQQVEQQGWHWNLFWKLNNEHRIVLPRMALMGIGILSDYNTRAVSFFGQGLVLLVYWSYLRYLWGIHLRSCNWRWRLVAAFLAGAACYSSKQYENFLWNFQIVFLTVLCASVLAFFHLARALKTGRCRDLFTFTMLGIVASFSSLHGLLVWPVSFIAVLLGGVSSKKPFWRVAGCILLLGLLVGAAYSIGYHRTYYHAPSADGGFLKVFLFFLAASGGWGAIHYPLPAVGVGILGLILACSLFCRLWRARRMHEFVFPLCLLGLGYGVAAMLAVGRSGVGDGIGLALASKYASFTMLIYIGLLLAGYQCWAEGVSDMVPPAKRNMAWAGMVVLTLCMLMADAAYLYGCLKWKRARQEGVAIMQNHRSEEWAALQKIGPFPDEENARNLISWLEAREWNVFAAD